MRVIDPETILALQELAAVARGKLAYYEFCLAIGAANGSEALAPWAAWIGLCEGLAAFDAATLSRLLHASEATPCGSTGGPSSGSPPPNPCGR